jgi:hypothetical protein
VEPGVGYRALFFDPRTGDVHEAGDVTPDEDGRWEIPMQPEMSDWVLVLESSDWREER